MGDDQTCKPCPLHTYKDTPGNHGCTVCLGQNITDSVGSAGCRKY